jgi:hypothetical protein
LCLEEGLLQMSKTSSFTTSPFILPFGPGSTGHWEAEKRRNETKEWLRQREREIELRRKREIASPPIAPRGFFGSHMHGLDHSPRIHKAPQRTR